MCLEVILFRLNVLDKWFVNSSALLFYSTARCFCDIIMKEAWLSWLAEAAELWHSRLYCRSTQGQAKAVGGSGSKCCWQQQGEYLIWNTECEYCLYDFQASSPFTGSEFLCFNVVSKRTSSSRLGIAVLVHLLRWNLLTAFLKMFTLKRKCHFNMKDHTAAAKPELETVEGPSGSAELKKVVTLMK